MNAVASLARDQQALLRAVLCGHSDDALGAFVDANSACADANLLAQRGLRAYQSHGLALAERALGAAYPVIAQLMGDENFASLAGQFWRAQPPSCGDMAQWGGGMANFLAAAPQLADEPFLADVARIEWALHRASFAADSSADLSSFALLSVAPPAAPSLCLSPGTWLLDSCFPVVSLIHAHQLPAEDQKSALAHVSALMASGAGEKALVWRDGFKPRVRPLGFAEHALIRALHSGQSLDAALTQASHAQEKSGEVAFDLAVWLAHSVKSGLVTGACLVDHATDNNNNGTAL